MDNDHPGNPPLTHPLRWFPEFLEFGKRRFRTQGRVLGAAILVGIVAGLGGVAFTLAGQVVVRFALEGVAGYKADGPAGEPHSDWIPDIDREFRPWLLLIVPTVGGLLSGYLVFRYAPEAEGHGTDAAIAAYHTGQGSIRPRVPLIKLVASALTIGSGGSGGREGPIAQIGAGFGSLLATLLRYRVAERRILLAAGMGAGIAAIFRAPLAGTLFAAEILYCSPEFEPEVILPAGLASVVSYCTFGVVMGWLGDPGERFGSLFKTPEGLRFTSALELGPYLLLALWVALLSMLYVRTFYGVTHVFHRLRMPRIFKPAVGAFLTGAVGLILYYASHEQKPVLSVLSFGYGILQEGLSNEGSLAAGLLLAVALGKIATTSLTIGSGGSGGVFGPSMVIGGCGGGALGVFLHGLAPELVPHPASFIILGMAGFFAAAAKTPFSTLIIVSEMTGDYKLLLPALWVVTIAFLVSDEEPLYRSQVKSRALSPAHQGSYVREVLAGLKVSGFLLPEIKPPVLRLEEPLAAVIDRLGSCGFPALPVVDEANRLQGLVVLDEVHLAARSGQVATWVLAADLMRPAVQPLTPDDRLDQAMELFVEQDLLALPVVDNHGERHVIGLVRRSDLAQAYLRHLHGQRPAEGSPS
ncbi:MAG TPA: chloride channel protein [Gemmataceae bacterium]|nr:chloride channel protein [Gemmataceae bacterium]